MTDSLESQSDAIDELYDLFGRPRNVVCPLAPTARQEAFLLLDDFEAFFGGAAGGGKTVALLMAALQYVDVPGYHALLVRRSLAELRLPGNLIQLSHDWLAATKAAWVADQNMWRFPAPTRTGSGGASLTFGYLTDNNDVSRYAGSSFSYLAFDELTRFPETHYRGMFRVMRQATGRNEGEPARDGTRLGAVPVRLRSASNPGGQHHNWVKERFVVAASRHSGVVYMPSRLQDNPHLDYAEYAGRLAGLVPAERERLLYGDWDILDDGQMFHRDWITTVEAHNVPACTTKVRYWDLAASEPTIAHPDPDSTVGLLLELNHGTGIYYITDIVRARLSAGGVERLVRATAERDGNTVPIYIEQEGGGAGKALTDRYIHHVLRGFSVRPDRPTGPKAVRAQPVAAAAENGLLRIVPGRHTHAFLDELSIFPHGRHDDCVDALAGAHHRLSKTPRPGRRTSVPRGRIPGVGHRPGPLAASRGRFPTSHDPIVNLAGQWGATVYDTRDDPRTRRLRPR